MLVEVCANSLQSALNAEKAGADRIELCAALAVGGITPSYGLLRSVKDQISIPVNVLIRPRGGDFTYSDLEFEIMKKNIELCVELGFNGIVSGVLKKNFSMDVDRTKQLIDSSGDLQFTFHRAFDWVRNPRAVAAQLELLGVDTILTSGQESSAGKGIDLLTALHKSTSTLTIMPGAGVGVANVKAFKERGFEAVHLSGIKFHSTLETIPKVPMNSPSFLKDGEIAISDISTIEKLVRIVK